MKKITALLLLFLFLITNSGMTVSAHWCGGKLASIHFFSDDGHRCPCGKRAMKPGCCKDKTVTLKAIKDPAKVNQFAFKIAIPKLEVASPVFTEISLSAQFEHSVSDFYHPPPLISKSPLFLLDRVIRI